MEKCFIICRQSSGQEDPDDSLSIVVQEEECRKLALSKELDVLWVFKEANMSGRLYPIGFESMAAQDLIYQAYVKETHKQGQWRTELGKMLKRLGEVQYIVAYDLTRFFRPLTGSFLGSLMPQLLQAHGVKLLTLKEGVIDFSRFQDALVSSLTSQINSEQLRVQTEKSKAALKRMMDAGEYYPSLATVTGYKPTGKKHEVVVDEREAEVVKTVFKLYTGAVPMNKIVQHINRTYSDVYPQPCARGALRKMIMTPAYCGYQRDSQGALVKCKLLDGKEIVSVDLWMKAQEKLEAGKIHFKRPKKRWLPLSGLVVCGHCGANMRVASNGVEGKPAYYMCFKHLKTGAETCKNNVPESMGDDGVGLMEMVKPLLLAEAMKRMKTAKDSSKEKAELEGIELQLADAKKKLKKLTSLWMDGMMEEDVYESAVKELKERTASLERGKAKKELELSVDTSAFDWVKLMMLFRGGALSKGEYEQLATAMLKKVVVYQDFIDVKTVFGDVSIPRQRIRRFNMPYDHFIDMDKKTAKVYYYRGERMVRDLSKYDKTAQLGDLEVYVQR